MSKLCIVTDFDGTLTKKDIGNELCKVFALEKYNYLQTEYRAKRISLRDMQQQMWTDFPASIEDFKNETLRLGELRTHANEFLETCSDLKIPVYVVSCGIDIYIQSVLKNKFSAKAQSAILDTVCNTSVFEDSKLAKIIAPNNDPDSPYPLHKGKWAQNVRDQKHPGTQLVCIGNGSSDRSFLEFCDEYMACDAFSEYLKENNQEHIHFDDFKVLIDFIKSK